MRYVHHDTTLTKVINQILREHLCEVQCHQILPDITIMNIVLNKKVLIRNIQTMLENGIRFGIKNRNDKQYN